jgi:3-dehydroquinate synthase
MVIVQSGEDTKSLHWLAELYEELAELPADRRTGVVAVGGGVIGDLAGFAAATYARGLALLMVPTTLLAMVDSSVGGKTGINLPQGKNLVGAFHQPSGVWIAPEVLAGLPDAQYQSGLAEVVKYGVILDADFFAWLEGNVEAVTRRDPAAVLHVIKHSCRLKAGVTGADEREETGDRAALNYGHTFGHAFEAVAGYGAWTHGAAVAAGMVCASRLAERLGRVTADVTERQKKLLEAFGLPTAVDPAWPVNSLVEHMHRDKKAVAGRLRFVLPTRIGHVELVDGVPEADVRAVLAP